MPLPKLPYIDYANAHYPGARYDLACSNVPLTPLSSLAVEHADLDSHPAALIQPALAAVAAARGVDVDNLSLAAGCTGANLAMAAVLGASRPGARILLESPGYEPMWQTPTLFGLAVDRFERRWVDGRPVVEVDAVMDALQPGTVSVWITNLHNPSGEVTSNVVLAELALALKARQIILYVDEVYLDFAQQGSAFDLGDNVVVSSSLTKVYGLGGLRFGWLAAPLSMVRDLRRAAVHLVGLPPAPGIAYGLAALRDLARIRADAAGDTVPRLERAAELLARIEGGFWAAPDAGIFGLFHLPEAHSDDIAFCQRLIHEAGVVVAPGSFFGAPGTVRLGLASRSFDVAIARFVEFFE